jgi:hypothetical protein
MTLKHNTEKNTKKKIIHNIGLCKHKAFFGMEWGHCIKCGKAFKNCDICFPNNRIDAPFPKCKWCNYKGYEQHACADYQNEPVEDPRNMTHKDLCLIVKTLSERVEGLNNRVLKLEGYI